MWMSWEESDSDSESDSSEIWLWETALDDPSSHDTEQRTDTWFLKSMCSLTMEETFPKSSTLASSTAGAWPFNSLSHFMGFMPGLRFWKLGCSTIWSFCACWFLKSNLNGIVKMRVARESSEWHNWNHTSYLWRDSSRSWQWLYLTSHHKKVTWRDHRHSATRLQCKKKLRKDLDSKLKRTVILFLNTLLHLVLPIVSGIYSPFFRRFQHNDPGLV